MSEFTDLSQPLEITDPVKFRAAVHTIMSILFYNAVEPVEAHESVPCLTSNMDSQSRNNLEASHDPQRAPAA